MAGCETHPFDPAEGTCRTCHRPFCAGCLVYSAGPDRPPHCVPCALVAAGVRRGRRGSPRVRAEAVTP
jgi:hypothetical protein